MLNVDTAHTFYEGSESAEGFGFSRAIHTPPRRTVNQKKIKNLSSAIWPSQLATQR
jgi:hypothetical protein